LLFLLWAFLRPEEALEMSNLKETIANRHGRDRWKDALFIAGAVLLTALSIGSVTRKAQGHTTQHAWGVTMVETPDLAR
jgi:hypothetical protein